MMTADPRTIKYCLNKALHATIAEISALNEHKELGCRHRNRSNVWLYHLAHALKSLCFGEVHLEAVSVSGREFLFDIVVAEGERGSLPFLSKRLWAVECEFARRLKDVGRDLTKLTWASAESRLLIVSSSENVKSFLQSIASSLSLADGILYVAHIPHPEYWTSQSPILELWQLRDGKWQVIE